LPIDDVRALVEFDLPKPTIGDHDLLVRVEAISVNPVDVKVRSTSTPPAGSPRVLGFDAAGVVEDTGAHVSLFRKGDAVFYAGAIDRPGTNAQFHAVDERIVGGKPGTLSFREAAALPLTALTAWELLFDRLRVPRGQERSNDALLVINGAGGVGSILTQLARHLTGLTVIATASRAETKDWCYRMGAHHVINHRNPLDQELKSIGFSQVRYIAALSASDHHHAAIVESVAPQGAVALIDDPKTFDILPFKRKSVSLHWELMFTRSLFQTSDMVEQHRILSEVSALVDDGVLCTTLHADFGVINATNVRRAHATLESGNSVGKIVLSGFG
jgi:zinc-binding alcohol dehydrogenase family protein